MLPKYAKAINPDLQDEDMMPATLSPEIMQGLLRKRLGFNGMVVTDASHMVGMTNRMTRREMLPRCINAGGNRLRSAHHAGGYPTGSHLYQHL